MKPLGNSSLRRSVLRALGMDKGSVAPSLCYAEAKPDRSTSHPHHDVTRTALLEAEKAKAKAIMDFRRKTIL